MGLHSLLETLVKNLFPCSVRVLAGFSFLVVRLSPLFLLPFSQAFPPRSLTCGPLHFRASNLQNPFCHVR